MVNSSHEAAHRIFQEHPDLLVPVFRLLDVPLPAPADVEVLSPDATEIRPLERRVDSVLRVRPKAADDDGFLLAIEAQGRRDAEKPASWAYYLAYMRAKYAVPVLLLVTCQEQGTARWASGPFALGPDGWRAALSVRPLVLGPGNVPVIRDAGRAARDLALATFSAITHARDADAAAILEALATALGEVDDESAEYFTELLEIGLAGSPAGDVWRDMARSGVFFPGRGTLVEEYYLKGAAATRVEERSRMILRILDHRGIPVPDDVRERIRACDDADMLDRWADRALDVAAAGELFAEDTEHAGGGEAAGG
ncbi:hypothetical protein [Streptomyces boncukensis]|uniref:Uncharacterized protein n=1 Tax=Streptomyces boncukensis TaxID=2711219 RepID=A0A6G4WR01_9ACTN|nr:hypothetical protein [Streptomyces boncukensis]NGO66921.1 hypothetical protein [Streptomyces boncukensis]